MKLKIISFILFVTVVNTAYSQTVNLNNYISNFDLKWNEIPIKWEAGAFLGNGRVGTMIWGDSYNGIRFDIGNNQVYNQKSRTPIGKFVVKLKGEISDFEMVQSLVKSEVKSTIRTNLGDFSFETFIDESDIIRVKYTLTEGEKITIAHVPLPGMESDKLMKALKPFSQKIGIKNVVDFTNKTIYEHIYNLDEVKNLPKEETGIKNNIHFRKVPFDASSGYILLWNINETESVFSYTTHFYKSEKEANLNTVLDQFSVEISKEYHKTIESNYALWEGYFNESFISIPDKRIEANYWAQIYKMRAATKKGELPIDLLGTWFRATPWPRIWANLNVQITYPAMNQTNKFEIASTLFDYMDANQQLFINAIDEKFQHNGASISRGWAPYGDNKFNIEYGNYLWLLYNYSQFLSYFPNDKRQQEKYYPMLKRGLNFVMAHLFQDENGKYHVPKDVSPEYKIKDKIPLIQDNSYNIGLLNWALSEALNLSDKFNDNTSEIQQYKKVYANLTPLNIDEKTGIMVGKDYKMDVCHRHFSHLISFYPLGVLDISNIEDYALCNQSLERWISRPHSGWGYKGYTYTAASAMYARLGKAEEAVENLNKYLDDFTTPNTFYLETGPVIETALHSSSATLELLLQSYTKNFNINELRIFPAVPVDWKNASFSKLRAEGGYIVSATLKNNVLSSAFIESTRDANIRVLIPAKKGIQFKTNLNSIIISYTKNNYLVLEGNLKKGEILILGDSTSHEAHIQKVSGKEFDEFHYGLN